jgi:hypothetical protein
MRLIVVAIVLMFATILALAQDASDSPLLNMLARVPDVAGNRSQIIYADRGAVEAVYPGTAAPANWGEFMVMNDAAGDAPDLLPMDAWWRVFMNMAIPTSNSFRSGEETEAVMGFDYFEIARELSYGIPPEQGLILEGAFDEEAVRAALGDRGYHESDAGLWCGTAGCDGGNQLNPAARNPANIFGGDLGREQPVFVGDDTLMSSPSLEQVEGFIDASAGEVKSLADDPAYQAAVGAASEQGTILQASFLDGSLLMAADPAAMLLSREDGAMVLPVEDFITIPQYSLIMVADVVSDEAQIGVAAFVYPDAAQAETAVAEMARRLGTLTSLRTRQLYADMLKDRRATIETLVVERDGLAVALVLLSTPKATAEQIVLFSPITDPDDLPPVTAPGLIYRFLLDGVFSRDDLWYSTVPREIVEELVGE